MIYNPAFDLYHCVYRLLLMISKIEDGCCVEVDRLRIYDFLVLFPYKIMNVKLKREEKKLRRSRNSFGFGNQNPYNQIKEDRKVFERMKSYQLTALKYIASYGVIESESLVDNVVKVKERQKINEFLAVFNGVQNQDFLLMNWLFENFSDIPIMGENGLKRRTNLMEWKYDPA